MVRAITPREVGRLARSLGTSRAVLLDVARAKTRASLSAKRRDKLRELGLIDDRGLTKLGLELFQEARRRGF